MRLVTYARVSTNGQALKGISVEEQEEACREWAALHDHELVGALRDEGKSGMLPVERRPGLAAALVEIEDGRADGLIVREADRLARELHVQEAVLALVWTAGGHVFEAVHGEVLQDNPDDPMRTFLRQVMGAAQQLDGAMGKLRMQRGRARKAAAGGYIGGRVRERYGYRLTAQDGGGLEYVPDPAEQAVIQQMIAMRDSGATLWKVADTFRPEGTSWTATTVRRIILRERV